MTTTVKLILAQPLIAGAPPTVGHVMGNRMLHRGAFAQGSATTLGLDLVTELLLELLVLAAGRLRPCPSRAEVHRARTEPPSKTLAVDCLSLAGPGRSLWSVPPV